MPERTRNRTTARATLVSAAIDHLAIHGPAGVQPQDICRELGISKALVNYHFGTREGLIAEAMVQAYEDHVTELETVAQQAGDDPVARLFAWIDHQIDWTSSHSGLAAALDFPQAALGRSTLEAELADRLAEGGRRNFAHLRGLVRDARAKVLADAGVAAADVSDDEENGYTTAVVGWLALGAAVWIGGKHLPMRQTHGNLPMAREHMRTLISEMLSRR